MAQIDVSDLLADPDFVDMITLVDRRPSINLFGENELQEVSTVTVGSVQPASGRVVNRLPEALRVLNLSSFWYRGTITTSSPGKYSAVLVFKGMRYNVMHVFDWTNWGAGWSEGVCVAEALAP